MGEKFGKFLKTVWAKYLTQVYFWHSNVGLVTFSPVLSFVYAEASYMVSCTCSKYKYNSTKIVILTFNMGL